MKTLIVIRDADHRWFRELFPETSPLLMPVCNKPAVEYLIDFSILAGSTAIRIVSDSDGGDVERFCESGARWGVEINYANMQPSDDLRKIIERNRKFCLEERVMIISGILFVRYDRRFDYRSFIENHQDGELVSCGHGSIMLTGRSDVTANTLSPPHLSVPELDSVGHYFSLSQEVLASGAEVYVLPGYSNEADCHIGSNVLIRKGVEINRPVMIGNNVRILDGAVIGPRTVIGSNVIVDRKSSVVESMVLDDTYIGENLEARKRIAAGSLLLDPVSGACLQMEDRHLMSGIGRQRFVAASFMRRLAHAWVAGAMIALLLFPYLLIGVLLKRGGHVKKSRELCFSARRGDTFELTSTTIEHQGLTGEFAIALSLDRFAMLFKVLAGHLALIGCRPVRVAPGMSHLPDGASMYHPGVFSYAEAEAWPENALDSRIVDHYHLVHGSVIGDITMILKALFNRNKSTRKNHEHQ